MLKPTRILSIDIMRGLTLFLMLFVNDLYELGVPKWLVHTKAETDGMGLADWVFPGFLFMVGMSVPYAIASRKKSGQQKMQIFGHIITRTLSLLLIGILILNIGRINADLSGIDRNVWAILLYVSIFLIWNMYPDKPSLKTLFLIIRVIGIAGLLLLSFIFRSGDPQHVSWMEVGWWGILGLIGWGYFVAATACLILNARIGLIAILWGVFVILNILAQVDLLGLFAFLRPVFGVILDGNIPSIVLAGSLIGLMLSQKDSSSQKIILVVTSFGIACLLMGLVLHKWFIISKIQGTPSWAMICNGVSMLVYALLYFIVDVKGKSNWAWMFQAAGKNSLTTYLAPDVIYFICWGWSIPLFFYKQEVSMVLAVSGSIGWAVAMMLFSIGLSKIHIRLRL
ncbi:DUF5009 domain-containing protein [Olivibacter domesticus]|uniref:Predicted acyltransferase n=1 Tax=Olivibacter domesticus TaxID=407022 RepID=A0A1H7WC32_OLID1|nr:DUF5009 domain-containing protein [Olivibacter domesticus]SEM19116.1 Predicted acyltransferase [Olivibacter domesticus]